MLLQQFQTSWKHNFKQFASAGSRFLLAVSGGIDSIVLVDLFSKSGIPFSIAHCNFGLRGEESKRDEIFVTELAKQYNKELVVKRFDTESYASQNKISIQEAARKLRYDWFLEVMSNQISALSDDISAINYQPSTINFVATAHHANDNVETLLINFFRGTGIGGLHGILPKQNNIIRPLLFAKREEIEHYAKENGINWVEDSSNASDKYTRNFFRHQVLPLVKEMYVNAEDNLLQNIHRFSEAGILYNQAIEAHKKKLVEVKGNELHIPVLKLQKAQPLQTILWEIVKDFHFAASQLNDIQNLITADNGKYVASPTHRIIRNRAWLIISPQKTKEAENILIEEKDKNVLYEDGQIHLTQLSIADYQPSTEKHIASLDAEQIEYPLLLRKWKQGDYFYPLGMKKKKKLSRFFIDSKLSKTEKEKVWVIEMNKKIIWVVGHRIDDRYKIRDNTEKVLRIKATDH